MQAAAPTKTSRQRSPTLGLALLLSCACAPAGEQTAKAPAAAVRDVLIVLIDALPARYLSCYGFELPTTPMLDAFAADSLRCDAAYAPAAYTLASVSSLFLGLPASFPRLRGDVLSASELTLAERFEAAGFATAAWSCNAHISAETQFDQGFAHFERYAFAEQDYQRVPAQLFADFEHWWQTQGDRPRFVYLHVLPPHQPYDAPPPFDQLFGAQSTTREQGSSDYLRKLAKDTALDPEDPRVQQIRARYLAGLCSLDAQLGAWLVGFAARGELSQAAVAVLSDHGEGFAEHGRILHSSTAYAEMTHVPLLLRWPGLAPGVESRVLSTMDLGPTLCALAGLAFDAGPAGGRSLLPLFHGQVQERGAAVLSRSAGQLPMWALRTQDWSLVANHNLRSAALFERGADPLEQHDLARQKPELASELLAELLRQLALDQPAASGTNEAAPTRAHGDELRKLGYAGDQDE